MNLSKKLKKFLFFWSIFHTCAYLTFLLAITPSFKTNEYSNHSFEYYFFTPKYESSNHYDKFGAQEMFPDCGGCEHGEEENFWPFHKFTNGFSKGASISEYFVGIWGFYGHYEFFVYMTRSSHHFQSYFWVRYTI
jgi:hypothetical protein